MCTCHPLRDLRQALPSNDRRLRNDNRVRVIYLSGALLCYTEQIGMGSVSLAVVFRRWEPVTLSVIGNNLVSDPMSRKKCM